MYIYWQTLRKIILPKDFDFDFKILQVRLCKRRAPWTRKANHAVSRGQVQGDTINMLPRGTCHSWLPAPLQWESWGICKEGDDTTNN